MHVKANAAIVIKGIELDLYNMPGFGNALTTYEGLVRSASLGFGYFSFSCLLNFDNNPFMFGSYTNTFASFIGSISTYKADMWLLNFNQNGVMDIVPEGIQYD